MSGLRKPVFTTAVIFLAAIVTTAPALAGNEKSDNHCISPSGLDLNEFWAVSEQMVAPFCPVVRTGERWRPSGPPWITAVNHDILPAGYVPSAPTPMADFLAKVQGFRYVLDPGTNQERTFIFGPEIVRSRDGTDGLPAANFLPLFHPVSRGTHTVVNYVTMSADHWDGLGTDPFGNLLPAGEFLWSEKTFEVAPPGKGMEA